MQRSRILPLLVLVLGATGCGRQALVSSDALPLKRVVLYRNGVGYFERSGHVDEEEVRFKMKQTEVGDFLATLAVMERGGSSVRAAAFPLDIHDDNEEAKPKYKMTEDEKKGLQTVALSLDGKAHDLVVGYVAESPVWRPSYRLVIHTNGEAELQAWGIVQNLSGEDWKDVRLSLVAGAPLAFDPQLGTPIIPTRPIVTDEGEVIAAVPRGETSLKEEPATPAPAPAMQPAPAGQAGADRDADGIPDAEDAEPDEPLPKDLKKADKRPAAVGGGKGGGAAATGAATRATGQASASAPRANAGPMGGERGRNAPAPPPPPPPKMELSAPRNVRSLAAIAVEAGTTRYDLPVAVTVPDKSATMVMLLSRKVAGEASFLFAPDGGVPDSMRNPFRVARFTNATNGVLEKGAIAVFEDGSFLGQGMMDPLPAGASATVPFALERAIGIDRENKWDELGERIAKIENGELTIERDSVMLSKYRVKNGGDKAAKVIVKHARINGARLHDPPKGTEDNVGTGSALVPGTVAAHATGEVVVDERSTVSRREDWFTPVADNAVKAYLADPKADAGVKAKLQSAWQLRTDIVTKQEARTKLAQEQQNLAMQSEETRRNLRAIEKNKQADQLRANLTKRLGDMATRTDELTKQVVELDAKLAELRVRFRETVREIKIVVPPPK